MRMPRPGRGLGSVAPIACPLALQRVQVRRAGHTCGVWMLHRRSRSPPAINTSSPQMCSHDGDSRHVPLPIPWHVLMVTRLAWIAHRLVSSSRCTMKSSDASCKASKASAVHRKGSGLIPLEISRTCAMRWVDHVTDVARAVKAFSFMAQSGGFDTPPSRLPDAQRGALARANPLSAGICESPGAPLSRACTCAAALRGGTADDTASEHPTHSRCTHLRRSAHQK